MKSQNVKLSCLMILISLGITTATWVAVMYALVLLGREVAR